MRMHETNLLLMATNHLLAFLQAPQEQLEHLLRIFLPLKQIKIYTWKALFLLSKILAADCKNTTELIFPLFTYLEGFIGESGNS